MQPLRWTANVTAPLTTVQARLELAAIGRLLVRESIAPVGAARIAVRDPQSPGCYLTNPGGVVLEELKSSMVVPIDRNGIRRDNGNAEPDSGALAIALGMLETRTQAFAAIQVASHAGTVVASTRDGILPMTQTSFLFRGAVTTHQWCPERSHEALREAIASDLGDDQALLVRGRGIAVCGDTAAQAWKLAFFLDKCCRSQIQAMAAANAVGRSLTIPSNAVVDHAVEQSLAFLAHPRFIADWPSGLEQLDAEDPSWRD